MYSGKTEDIGNNTDGTDMRAGMFGLHMRFFIEQLARVMRPGCNVCIHIQQLLRYKNQHGYIGRRDFRGAVVDLFESGGFEWKGEFVIPKNPQIIAKRLNLHCLMFETGRNNAANLAPAVNDYVMIFQKPGERHAPVPALYDAVKNPQGWVTQEEWIRDAHGVWDDIRETDVLEGWKGAREKDDEKHVCPLQLSVIYRLIRLYTNPGELVLDPFAGIGSTQWVALGGKTADGSVNPPRRSVGFELKESYHRQAEKNVALALKMAGSEAPLFANVTDSRKPLPFDPEKICGPGIACSECGEEHERLDDVCPAAWDEANRRAIHLGHSVNVDRVGAVSTDYNRAVPISTSLATPQP